jgi:hypothetical protein
MINRTVSERNPGTWTPEQVRAWVERHGGNVSAAARRLRWPRSRLQAALADPAEARTAAELPAYIQAHCETMDLYEIS